MAKDKACITSKEVWEKVSNTDLHQLLSAEIPSASSAL